jgi:hypothetical protein
VDVDEAFIEELNSGDRRLRWFEGELMKERADKG